MIGIRRDMPHCLSMCRNMAETSTNRRQHVPEPTILLTVREAAVEARMSLRTLRAMIGDGRWPRPRVMPNGRQRFVREEFLAFLKSLPFSPVKCDCSESRRALSDAFFAGAAGKKKGSKKLELEQVK